MRCSRLRFITVLLVFPAARYALAQPAVSSRPAFPQSAPGDTRNRALQDDLMNWSRSVQATGRPIGLGSFSDAELAEWCDLLVRTHAKKARDEYELTPEQEKAVARRLEALRNENLAYWRKHQAELRDLSVPMLLSPEARTRDGQASADFERYRANMKRRGALMMQQPLPTQMVTPEIERLLPPEQIEAARDRRRKREEQMRAAVLSEMGKRVKDTPARPTSRPHRTGFLAARPDAAVSNWEYYVRAFIRMYDLDETQQETARSILREMQAQRDRYEADPKEEYAEARNLKGPQKRLQRLSALNEPIVTLFDELRTRLDHVPTITQREAAAGVDREAAAPTMRPAANAPRPARP